MFGGKSCRIKNPTVQSCRGQTSKYEATENSSMKWHKKTHRHDRDHQSNEFARKSEKKLWDKGSPVFDDNESSLKTLSKGKFDHLKALMTALSCEFMYWRSYQHSDWLVSQRLFGQIKKSKEVRRQAADSKKKDFSSVLKPSKRACDFQTSQRSGTIR